MQGCKVMENSNDQKQDTIVARRGGFQLSAVVYGALKVKECHLGGVKFSIKLYIKGMFNLGVVRPTEVWQQHPVDIDVFLSRINSPTDFLHNYCQPDRGLTGLTMSCFHTETQFKNLLRIDNSPYNNYVPYHHSRSLFVTTIYLLKHEICIVHQWIVDFKAYFLVYSL